GPHDGRVGFERREDDEDERRDPDDRDHNERDPERDQQRIDALSAGLSEGARHGAHWCASCRFSVQRRYGMTTTSVMTSSITEIALPRPKSPSCMAWVYAHIASICVDCAGPPPVMP